MVQAQVIDCQNGNTIITSPTNLKGKWTVIIPMEDLTGVVVIDNNLTANSEKWIDGDFKKHNQITGKFTEITAVGRVALYA